MTPNSTGSDLTGVFIAVDCALEAVEEEGRVDVWDVVNKLRHQRPKMVLTLVRPTTTPPTIPPIDMVAFRPPI